MISSVFVHWKTTIAGLIAAVAAVPTTGATKYSYVLAVGIALLGFLAADSTSVPSVQK